MVCFAVRLHVSQIDDASRLVDESNAQGQWRVAHPEARHGHVVEYEQHAVVRGEGFAEHQAAVSDLGGGGYFHIGRYARQMQRGRG